MKIFKISQTINNLKELSEFIQDKLLLYDEDLQEYEGIDFDHRDWDIQGNRYVLPKVPSGYVSILIHDDDELVPTILGKEYEICESLEEASDVILNILMDESDDDYEEYQDLSMEETFQKNIRNIPRTTYWPHVGYILRDGTALDFSGGGRSRTKDHRAIYDGSFFGVQSFMLIGNIRVNVNDSMEFAGLDIYVEPNEAQYATLREMMRDIAKMNGEVQLDLANGVDSFDERNQYYTMKDKLSVEVNAYSSISTIENYYEKND